MRSNGPKEIVINGVRFNLAIRRDNQWSYSAEWWNRSEYHKHTLGENVRSISEAEREAIAEIHKAHLKQEPWLYAEISPPKREESCIDAGPG